MLRPTCGLLLALCLAPSLVAQAPAADAAQLAQHVAAWRAEHGPAWRALAHADTGRLEFLYGGSAAPSRAPVTDEDFAVLALEAVARTRAMHGIAPEELTEARVHFLPLAQIGSTDKLSVSLTQSVGGLSVRDGTVHCLFDVHGRLLALQSRGVAEADRIELTPLVPAQRARAIAAAALAVDEHEVATFVGDAALELVRTGGGRLAWRVEARNEMEGAMPAGRTYWIDARDGAVLDSERSVHELEVRGNVRALVTPGTAPDTGSNPEISVPMRYLDVSSSAGNTRTDANGDFTLPGVTTPLAVTVAFTGAYNNVVNVAGSEYTLTTTLPPDQDNVLTMNPSSSAQITAQGNAFHHVNLLRDYVRAIDPSDTHADFTATSNVNLSQTCNAYFDGGSTNYFLAGGGCVNTAYSTVVAHEMGHWLNVRYGTGNGPDGMGEGNADVFAMYLYDTPIVGLDFCGPGCSIRTGNNTRAFCGDTTPQCHGEVHADGEVWMGAAWKVRVRLNTALGDVMGDLTANTLFIGWMNAFNQSQIRSIIETQWLVLDDDDGNLNDGSPHYAQIDGGFRQQGFPGVDLHPVTIEDVTLVPDSSVEVGPYGIEARVRAHQDFQQITSASLSWRVNGGAWTQMPLVPQGGDVYGNSIPRVATPAQVDYYIEATDSLGNSLRWPGPASHEGFRVGAQVPFWSTDFESGPAGWTHSTYGDTSNPGDEWELGAPNGASGAAIMIGQIFHWRDPSAAVSGSNCWGVDLGNNTNGNYGINVHCRLTSPVVDCTGFRGVHLRFQRWLSVQFGSADQARIRVNGNVVWSNSLVTSVLETAWSPQDIDISPWADDNASVQIDFELASNAAVQLGGWNVDDVELTRLGPGTQDCTEPTTYGPGKLNSAGNTARLVGVGQPSLQFGPFHIRLEDGVPLRAAMVYSSSAPAATPLLGGTMLVAQPLAREIGWQLDAFGNATALYPVTPALIGTTRFFQCLFRDPASADGTGMGFSKALRVGFCP